MSLASRARRQRLLNRLEELKAKLGPLEYEPEGGVDLRPSWGPLGSLAQLETLEYSHLIALHEQLLTALGLTQVEPFFGKKETPMPEPSAPSPQSPPQEAKQRHAGVPPIA